MVSVGVHPCMYDVADMRQFKQTILPSNGVFLYNMTIYKIQKNLMHYVNLCICKFSNNRNVMLYFGANLAHFNTIL